MRPVQRALGSMALVAGGDVGRIEIGRDADVVILDSDPRADTTALNHIDTVIRAGAVVNRGEVLRQTR